MTKSDLRDKNQFFRFLSVSVVGTIADFLLALFLTSVLLLPYLVSSTAGFLLGSFINYCGHAIFSYEHAGRETISAAGYAKYLSAILLSLVVRLVVVAVLGFVSALPFWLILLIAIGASFVASYIISTLWVFKRPG